MTDLESLRGLEKRLAEASGADRVLDFWLSVELGPNPLTSDTGTEARPTWVNDSGQEYELWNAAGRYGFIGHHVVPNLTASADAAIALAERVIDPKVCIETSTFTTAEGVGDHRCWYATIHWFGSFTAEVEHERGNLALALCLATVRALIAEQSK